MKSERNGILNCRKGFETGVNSRFTARCAGKIIALMLVLSFMLSLLPLGATEVSAASEGGYTYEVSDGKATITDMDESAAVGDISIPSELGGYPVTAIGKEAFYSCDALTSVIIPDGVTEIGEEAFSKCYKLASITLPDSVTEIGRGAFFFCSALTSITLPEGVTTIGNYVFSSCIILDEIEVSPENPNYTSVDGVLFTKDMKTLIQYPEGKSNSEYAIPDGVTTIGDNAFFSCDFLTSVTIPDSVKTIGDRAFYLCTALLSITIPNSVTKIGEGTFSQCPNLTVKCTEGSYAQEYLERNDIRFTYLTSDTDMSFGGSETSTSSSSDTDAQEDNVIIIAVAAAVCAVIIAVAACIIVRRKKHNTARSQDNGQGNSQDNCGDTGHSQEQEPNRDIDQNQGESQNKG